MGPLSLAFHYRSSRRSAHFLHPNGEMLITRTTGLEAVVFVGGVSLGQPAVSIPIAAIVGLICGLIAGFLIYEFASRTSTKCLIMFYPNINSNKSMKL